MSYRLLQGAEDDIDLILLKGADDWGLDASVRYNRLMLAVFTALGASPGLRGSKAVPGVDGVRAYHLRLGRHWVEAGNRVGQPRHLVVYRIGGDGVVEVIGLAHDRMMLTGAALRMQRLEAGDLRKEPRQ